MGFLMKPEVSSGDILPGKAAASFSFRRASDGCVLLVYGVNRVMDLCF
jgi:hypothetical protein